MSVKMFWARARNKHAGRCPSCKARLEPYDSGTWSIGTFREERFGGQSTIKVWEDIIKDTCKYCWPKKQLKHQIGGLFRWLTDRPYWLNVDLDPVIYSYCEKLIEFLQKPIYLDETQQTTGVILLNAELWRLHPCKDWCQENNITWKTKTSGKKSVDITFTLEANQW